MLMDVSPMVSCGRCLVIGARGFLGRHVTARLRKLGVSVSGTTRDPLAGESDSSIVYEFPSHPIEDRIGHEAFDCAIVAGRLTDPGHFLFGSAGGPRDIEEFAAGYGGLFSQLNRVGPSGTEPTIAYVSSDSVFSGDTGGYLEDDEPDGAGEYGSMHRAAERSLMANASRPIIVRTSFMFDAHNPLADRRVSRLHKALTSGAEFFGDTNVFKSPVPVTHVADMVVNHTIAGKPGIFHAAAPRQSIHAFFAGFIQPLGLSEFSERFKARESAQTSDTSLRSKFEDTGAR
jgi:nucleoside-diphosphate-sugar epimerase